MIEPSQPRETLTAPRLSGESVIRGYVAALPNAPGVYRMLDANGEALYVGKARDLKKRVAAYTHAERLSLRLHRMVAATVAMEFVTTHTEVEALLLESNLIKRLKPRYNILLRDDKSFPSILVTADHPFPQILKHRGAQSRKGQYFGPFASGWAVNRTLTALQRAFLLRTCSDAIFQARTRPCLLHQIKRCSAPCVGRISAEDYAQLLEEARAFLSGGSQRVQHELARRMEEASAELRFEDAARYRDRVRASTAVQTQQDINLAGLGDADLVAAYQAGGATSVQVFFFRGGCNYGNRVYFPQHGAGEEIANVLEAFIGQFYAAHPPPPLVLTSHPLPNHDPAEAALAARAQRPVRVHAPQRGTKLHLMGQAIANAREALSLRLAQNASHRRLLEDLSTLLELDAPPERIEVYDNSHISGSDAVGAMVVAGPDGLCKNAYRKFTIRGTALTPGDDFAMMREVLRRRFSRALAEESRGPGGQWPDLVLIDGGAGQPEAALSVLADLGIEDVVVAAIAKGVDRNAGRERIFLKDKPPLAPKPDDPVLHLLQRLRDEAHRFAIGAHRARRSARIGRSQLDEIPSIGAHRKKALLHHFGSAQAVAAAGCPDLEAVPGISRAIAKKIYDWFHPQG